MVHAFLVDLAEATDIGGKHYTTLSLNMIASSNLLVF